MNKLSKYISNNNIKTNYRQDRFKHIKPINLYTNSINIISRNKFCFLCFQNIEPKDFNHPCINNLQHKFSMCNIL